MSTWTKAKHRDYRGPQKSAIVKTAMSDANIYVTPVGERDWVVKEASGREFGHYATKSEAQSVGAKLAQKRKTRLVVDDEQGYRVRTQPARTWLGRLFGG